MSIDPAQCTVVTVGQFSVPIVHICILELQAPVQGAFLSQLHWRMY